MPLVGEMMEELVAALPPLGDSKVRIVWERVVSISRFWICWAALDRLLWQFIPGICHFFYTNTI